MTRRRGYNPVPVGNRVGYRGEACFKENGGKMWGQAEGVESESTVQPSLLPPLSLSRQRRNRMPGSACLKNAAALLPVKTRPRSLYGCLRCHVFCRCSFSFPKSSCPCAA